MGGTCCAWASSRGVTRQGEDERQRGPDRPGAHAYWRQTTRRLARGRVRWYNHAVTCGLSYPGLPVGESMGQQPGSVEGCTRVPWSVVGRGARVCQ